LFTKSKISKLKKIIDFHVGVKSFTL